MGLAIFDLDNTLLAGDSDYLWGQYLVDNHLVDAGLYARENERFYTQYREGRLDILEFMTFVLRPLTEHSLENLYSWRHDFVTHSIKPIITDQALSLVDKHRRQGDTPLIITATNRFVTEPIARLFGIEHLLATDLEMDKTGTRYTGQVAGTPCFQQGKVTRLDAWRQENNASLEDAWFYSDSHNDLPLLNLVDHPVAVDPDDTLKKIAQQQGWSVLSLRS